MVYSESTPGALASDEQNDTKGKLKIVKHGNQRRATITIPLVVGSDDDIIADLDALPRMKRLDAVRNAIRAGRPTLTAIEMDQSEIVEELRAIYEQGKEVHVTTNKIIDVLGTIWERLEWISGLFESLHTYLEGKFAKIGRVVVSPFDSPVESDEEAQARATEEQLELRKANLKKRKFK